MAAVGHAKASSEQRDTCNMDVGAGNCRHVVGPCLSMSFFQEFKSRRFAHALTVQNGPKNFVSEEDPG